MTDPKRWLEDERAAHSLEARVLAAGTELRPPAELVSRSFADFAALAGFSEVAREATLSAGDAAHAAPGAALSTAAAAGGAGLSASVLKAVGLGALFGTLTMTAAHLLQSESTGVPESLAPSTAASHPALRAAPRANRWGGSIPDHAASRHAFAGPDSAQAAARPLLAAEPPSGERSPTKAETADVGELASGPPRDATIGTREAGTASVATFPAELASSRSIAASSARPPASESALKAEALQLAQAKNWLQQGRASEALPLLVNGSQRFANGALGAERELLIVQALSSLGQREEARRRALAFLASHGEGPISLRLRRLIDRQ